MRFLAFLILLAFPFAEIFVIVKLAQTYGWWLFVYLVVIGYLGLQLIRGEKLLISAKMMQSLTAGGNPMKAMIGSARNMVAGVLLMIPGVITDAIAVILLLIPIKNSKPIMGGATNQQTTNETPFNKPPFNAGKAANDDVIEGEFTHIKDEPNKQD